MNELLLAAHNKIVRHNGIAYRILAFKLGGKVLADADPIKGGERITLVQPRLKTKGHATRVTAGAEILTSITLGLVS